MQKSSLEEVIDWMIENNKDANWDAVTRAMDILNEGFRQKSLTKEEIFNFEKFNQILKDEY